MKWNGDERRKIPSDHDTLIRLMAVLEIHVLNFNQHVADDKENFKVVGDKLWSHAKFIYMGLGAVGIIEILMGLHK